MKGTLMLFNIKWSKLSYFTKAGLLSLPFSIILLILLGLFGDINIIFSEWYFDLIPIPAFIGAQLSSQTYWGREIDLITSKDTSRLEIWTTGIGITFGLVTGIALTVFIPGTAGFFDVVQSTLFIFNWTSVAGGLGNRVGTSFGESIKLPHEKRAIKIGGLIGLALSIALLVTGGVGAVSIIGISALLTGGASIPFWIVGGIFLLQTTSRFASASDYSGKTYTLFKATVLHDPKAMEVTTDRKYEYRGTATGLSTGLIIGLTIITALAITQPHIVAGLIGVAIGTIIIVTAISIFAGLFGNICKIMDRTAKAKEATQKRPESIIRKLPSPTRSPSRSDDFKETPSPRSLRDQSKTDQVTSDTSSPEEPPPSPKVNLTRSSSKQHLSAEEKDLNAYKALAEREKSKLKCSQSFKDLSEIASSEQQLVMA